LPAAVSAELLDAFPVVLVILTARLYIVEKADLRFGGHIIHTEAEACGRPSAQELR
jgi:hypothetical protein